MSEAFGQYFSFDSNKDGGTVTMGKFSGFGSKEVVVMVKVALCRILGA